MQDGETDSASENSVWKDQCKKKYSKKYFIHAKQCCMKRGRNPNSETSEVKLTDIWRKH